jgi:hypothetical protein
MPIVIVKIKKKKKKKKKIGKKLKRTIKFKIVS